MCHMEEPQFHLKPLKSVVPYISQAGASTQNATGGDIQHMNMIIQPEKETVPENYRKSFMWAHNG